MLKNRGNTGPSSVSTSAFTPHATSGAGVITSFYRWKLRVSETYPKPLSSQ